VKVTDIHVKHEKLFEVLPEYLKTKDHVEVMWFNFTPTVVIKAWTATTDPITEESVYNRYTSKIKRKLLVLALNGILELMRYAPDLTVWHTVILKYFFKLSPVVWFPERTIVMNTTSASQYVDGNDVKTLMEFEIAFPYALRRKESTGASNGSRNAPVDISEVEKAWRTAVDEVSGDDQKGKCPCNCFMQMRFLKSSQALLSPANISQHLEEEEATTSSEQHALLTDYGTCFMAYTSFVDPGSDQWDGLVKDIWKTWRTIPSIKLCWCKDMLEDSSVDVPTDDNHENENQLDVQGMYGAENVERFLHWRRHFDPEGLFASEFARRMFKI